MKRSFPKMSILLFFLAGCLMVGADELPEKPGDGPKDQPGPVITITTTTSTHGGVTTTTGTTGTTGTTTDTTCTKNGNAFYHFVTGAYNGCFGSGDECTYIGPCEEGS